MKIMKNIIAVLVALVSLATIAPAAQPAASPDVRLVLLIAVDGGSINT